MSAGAASLTPLPQPAGPSRISAEGLCLSCGICCDGTLFKDVRLQSGDDAVKLRAAGLPVSVPTSPRAVSRFPQPCGALCADKRCRVYADRPRRCREFECALLKAAISGEVTVPAALRVIQRALGKAGEVRRSLRALGDAEESLALSLRFRRVKKRVESSPLDDETADTFARLSLAVHDLNLLLRERFYP